MKTLITVLLTLAVGLAPLAGQTPSAFIHMDSVRACAKEEVLIEVRLSGDVKTQGLRSFDLHIQMPDTALMKPLLSFWNAQTGMGEPLLFNIHPLLNQRGSMICNFVRMGQNPYFSLIVSYVDFALHLPPLLLEDNAVMFAFKLRVKQNLSQTEFIAISPDKRSQISYNSLANQQYDLSQKTPGRVFARSLPKAKAGPGPSPRSIAVCTNTPFRFDSVSGGLRYRWYSYPKNDQHWGFVDPETILATDKLSSVNVPNPVFITDVNYKYNFLLEVSDEHGCVAYDSVEINALRYTLMLNAPEQIHIKAGASTELAIGAAVEEFFTPLKAQWGPVNLIQNSRIDSLGFERPKDPTKALPPQYFEVIAQTKAVQKATMFWVDVKDRFGCGPTVNIPVNIISPNLSASITAYPSASCGVLGEKKTIQLDAVISGGTAQKSYMWTARKLYNGFAEPKVSEPTDKKTEAIIYGPTELILEVRDHELNKSVVIIDTLHQRPIVNVKAVVGYDDKAHCVNDHMRFEAVTENQGQNPRYQWLINNIEVAGETQRVFETNTLNPGQTVSFVLYSSEQCPNSEAVSAKPLLPDLSYYQITAVQVEPMPQDSLLGCLDDQVDLKIMLYNPGSNALLSIYRNGKILKELDHTQGPGTFYIPAKTENFWDSYAVKMRNRSSACLAINDRMTNAFSGIHVSNQPLKAGAIVSDLGGDTVCADPTMEYRFELQGVSGFGMNTEVIWLINDQEWGRYHYPANSIPEEPQPPKIGGVARSLNTLLNLEESAAFATHYPFYLNKDGFPKIGVDFKEGDELRVIVSSVYQCGGDSLRRYDTTSVLTPLFIPIEDATIVLTSDQDPTQLCAGEPFELRAQHRGAGRAKVQWWLNDKAIPGDAETLRIESLKSGDTLRAVLSSNYRCAANLPLQSDPMIVTVQARPQFDLPKDTLVCAGDAFTQPWVSAAALYRWFPETAFVDPNIAQAAFKPLTQSIKAGVELTIGRCHYTDTVQINVAPKIKIGVQLSATDTILCRGEMCVLSAQGSNAGNFARMTWLLNGIELSHEGTSYRPTMAVDGDRYQVRLDASLIHTCYPNIVKSEPLVLTVREPFKAEINYDDAILCSGEQKVLTAVGGSQFRWESTDPSFTTSHQEQITVSPTNTHTYFLFSSDGSACTDSTSLEITVDPNIPIRARMELLDRQHAEYCALDDRHFRFKIEMENPGFYPVFTWHINQHDSIASSELVLNLSDGDSVWCEAFSSMHTCAPNPVAAEGFRIRELPVPDGYAWGDTLLCAGQPTLIQAQGGERYRWYPEDGLSQTQAQSAIANDVQDRVYHVDIIGPNGCARYDSVTVDRIELPEPLDITIGALQDSLCIGEMMTLKAQCNYPARITWYRNGNVWTDPVGLTHTYQAAIGDSIRLLAEYAQQCLNDSTVWSKPFSPALFVLDIRIADSLNHCARQELLYQAPEGALNYTWYERETIIGHGATLRWKPTTSTTLTLRSAIGACLDQDSMKVRWIELPLDPKIDDYRLCKETKAMVFETPLRYDLDYLWFSDTTQAPYVRDTFVYSGPMTVFVKVRDADQCLSPLFVPVKIWRGTLPVIDFEVDRKQLPAGETAHFKEYVDAYVALLWHFGDGQSQITANPEHRYARMGVYDVALSAQSSDGCWDTLKKAKYIKVGPALEGIFIPTAFAPSSSHPEDRVFKVYGEDISTMKMVIYDQQSRTIFVSEKPEIGWDGGSYPAGSYVYHIEVIRNNNVPIVRKGVVTLIR